METMLRLITYLSPSIPAGLYELLARELGGDLAGREADYV
jgi:hypothetical protein